MNQLQLEAIVAEIAAAVIATTETVEKLAERVDTLAKQMQNQGEQVQQQSYQIFALSEALQAFIDSQNESNENLEKIGNSLTKLVEILRNNAAKK